MDSEPKDGSKDDWKDASKDEPKKESKVVGENDPEPKPDAELPPIPEPLIPSASESSEAETPLAQSEPGHFTDAHSAPEEEAPYFFEFRDVCKGFDGAADSRSRQLSSLNAEKPASSWAAAVWANPFR